jgi:hypothetical protein
MSLLPSLHSRSNLPILDPLYLLFFYYIPCTCFNMNQNGYIRRMHMPKESVREMSGKDGSGLEYCIKGIDMARGYSLPGASAKPVTIQQGVPRGLAGPLAGCGLSPPASLTLPPQAAQEQRNLNSNANPFYHQV